MKYFKEIEEDDITGIFETIDIIKRKILLYHDNEIMKNNYLNALQSYYERLADIYVEGGIN